MAVVEIDLWRYPGSIETIVKKGVEFYCDKLNNFPAKIIIKPILEELKCVKITYGFCLAFYLFSSLY